MIGIDLTKINRFENKSNRFIEKILHKNEIDLLKNENNKAKFLAIRWSIKEALFKIDNSLFSFNKIEIKKDNFGRYKFRNYYISTTNEDGFIIAIAKKAEY